MLVIIGMIGLGLVSDAGGLALARARLDQATEAAAHAARAACNGAATTECLDRVASQYLHAHQPQAAITEATVDDTGKVTVAATLMSVRPFGRLFGVPAVTLDSTFSASW